MRMSMINPIGFKLGTREDQLKWVGFRVIGTPAPYLYPVPSLFTVDYLVES